MNASDAVDLSSLIGKLGHNLQEIRVRALQNLLSKLSNRILTYEELVHEKALIVNLFEWFNFEDPPMKLEVLQLLESLSEMKSAAEHIHRIGGVSFLSHMRADITDGIMLQKVDTVLNNIFWLHSEDGNVEESGILVSTQASIARPGKAASMQYHHVPEQKENAFQVIDYSEHAPVQDHQPSAKENSHPDKSTSPSFHSTNTAAAISNWHSTGQRFPLEWVTLTPSDRHILSVTDGRLQSHNNALKLQSLEFFRDVLLQDFPAELFIQRPTIVKTILDGLSLPSGNNQQIIISSVDSVLELTRKLYVALLQSHNMNFLSLSRDSGGYASASDSGSAKTLTSSLQSTPNNTAPESPKILTQSASYNTEEAMGKHSVGDFESDLLVTALKSSQWTTLDYCCQVLNCALDLYLQGLSTNAEHFAVAHLIQEVLQIVMISEVMALWNFEAKDKKPLYNLLASLKKFGEVLNHLHMDFMSSQRDVQRCNTCKGLWSMLIILTRLSVRFVKDVVPENRFYEALPSELLDIFKLLICDPLMERGHPQLSNRISSIMIKCDSAFYSMHAEMKKICRSIEHGIVFISAEENQEKLCYQERLSLLSEGMAGLPLHCCETFVKKATALFSEIESHPSSNDDVIKASRNLFLQLLSHREDLIRKFAYESCLETIQDALCISLVTDPLSTKFQRAAYVVNPQVLQEILCFGSYDETVSSFAFNVIATLLLGRLNMSPLLWAHLLESLIPLLPFLQSLMVVDSALRKCIGCLTELPGSILRADGTSISLPPTERLRASLRLLFSRDQDIRTRGAVAAILFLTEEDKRKGTVVRYANSAADTVSDVFVARKTVDLAYETELICKTSMAASEIRQIWNIFVSDIEESLRAQALEQLCLLLNDARNLEVILKLDPVKSLEKEIDRTMLNASGTTSDTIVGSKIDTTRLRNCTTMLRIIAEQKCLERHRMACNKDLYLDLFKLAVLKSDDASLCRQIIDLFAVLLFDEVLKEESTDGARALCLPEGLFRSFILPSKIRPIALANTRKKSCTNVDYLEQEPFHRYIKMAWHLSISKCLPSDRQEALPRLCTHKDLALPEEDMLMLSWCIPLESVQSSIKVLSHAKHDDSVISGFDAVRRDFLVIFYQSFDMAERDAPDSDLNTLSEALANADLWNSLRRTFRSLDLNKTSLARVTAAIQFCSAVLLILNSATKDFKCRLLKDLLTTDGLMGYVLDGKNRALEPDLKALKRELSKEILTLLSSLMLSLRNSLEGEKGVYYQSHVGDVISMLLGSVSSGEAETYYDLPVLGRTLECLVHLTAFSGWSLEYHLSGETLCGDIAASLLQTLSSFHTERVGAADSFMGKGVICNTVIGLCHVARELQLYCVKKDWTCKLAQPWGDKEGVDKFPWLILLLTDRVLEVRWCAWALATSLLSHAQGARSIVNAFQVFPGGIWATATSVALDDFESPLVRNQACRLIMLLCHQFIKRKEDETTGMLWESMMVQDTVSKAVVRGLDAFFLLLDHLNVFGKIKDVVSSFPLKDSSTSTKAIQYDGFSTTRSTIASEDRVSTEYEPMESTSTTSTVKGSSSSSSSDISAKALTPRSVSEYNYPTGTSSPQSALIPPSSQGSANNNALESSSASCRSLVISMSDTDVSDFSNFDAGKLSLLLKGGLVSLAAHLVCLDPKRALPEVSKHNLLTQVKEHFHTGKLYRALVAPARRNVAMEYTRSCITSSINLTARSAFLLRCAARFDSENQKSLLGDTRLSHQVMSVFDVSNLTETKGWAPFRSYLIEMWTELLRLLAYMICKSESHPETTVKLFEVFTDRLECLVGFMVLLVYTEEMNCNEKADLLRPLMELIKLLFYKAYKLQNNSVSDKLASALDNVPKSSHNAFRLCTKTLNSMTTSQTQGAILTRKVGEFTAAAILDIYFGGRFSSNVSKRLCQSTLSSIFIICCSSRAYALEAGLPEFLIEDIKDLLAKLKIASLTLDKDRTSPRKEKHFLASLKSTLNLCRNFAYKDQKVKLALIEIGILKMVQSMWPWSNVDNGLFGSIIQLLAVLSACCAKAQHAICYCSESKSEEFNLFSSLVKSTVLLHSQVLSTKGIVDGRLRGLFGLLTNLSVITECRSKLIKESFLSHFLAVRRPSFVNKRYLNATIGLERLWIRLLAVFSFFADGAHTIFKTKGLLPRVMEIANDVRTVLRSRSLLVLRNLVARPSYRAILAATSDFLNTISLGLDDSSSWTQALAASALVFLLTNCNKAKVIVKRTNILRKLEDIDAKIRNGKHISAKGSMQGYEELKRYVREGKRMLTPVT